MAVIPFGAWEPDRAALGHPGLLQARNVLPSPSGYLPRRKFASVTNALDARPLAAIQATDGAGNIFQYAADAGKLYVNNLGVWTDRSKVGGYSTASEERWEMVAWKDKILATNFADNPQQSDLGGVAFSDLTTEFRARHLATVRDFVVAGDTTDATDGAVPSRIRWSAIGDETDWTVSPTTLADFQDLRTEAVLRIFGGEFGVILQRAATWRMTFVGAPVVFQFDEVLPGVGTISPGAAVRDGDSVFFLSDRGFFQVLHGSQARPIGSGRIDALVDREIDEGNLHRITSASDPSGQRLWWAYPGPGNSGGTPNRLVCYDRTLDRWSEHDESIELLWQAGGTGVTLDGLDSISGSLDALPASLDASRWVGGAPVLAAFDDSFKAGFFDGDPETAVLETGDQEITPGRRTRLNAWRPLVEGGVVQSQVFTRNRQTDDLVAHGIRDQSESGRFTKRTNARYHRFRFRLSDAWEHAVGYQIERAEARPGARRG